MNNHNEHHHDHGNGFTNGFLFGVIIGAAVVFFLFTEKGKRLLKTITEEGIEGFADLKDLVEDEMDDNEDEYDRAYEEEKSEHSHGESLHEEYRPTKAKRFFKGIKR